MEGKDNTLKTGADRSFGVESKKPGQPRSGELDDDAHYREVRVKLGQRIAELRAGKSWSQASFADACAMDRSTMGRIERGDAPLTIATLGVIAENLNVRLSDLFEDIA